MIIDEAINTLRLAADFMEAGDQANANQQVGQVILTLAGYLQQGSVAVATGNVAVAMIDPRVEILEQLGLAAEESRRFGLTVHGNKFGATTLEVIHNGIDYDIIVI